MYNHNHTNRYEILAPAGSYDCMIAAFNAGADAVYLGGNMFGARANADNFNSEQLIEAIEYAHVRGKKIFLTVNTLLKNNQIKEQLFAYLKPLYEAGLDAVIVQDFGVLSFIKRHFPNMDIHASTQMTVTGSEFATELKKLGVTRIVPARELSFDEIKSIYKATSLEIECFVHGALCYCYSGMCLLSSVIGGRSGNRGRCAQPCRLPYDVKFSQNNNEIKGEYPLSPADLCTLNILPSILQSGVYSLKIEGRMKKPEYVATVCSMYRKYLDMYILNGEKGYKIDNDDIRILKDIYNRGEFTDGFYKKHNGNDIMSVKRPNHMGTAVAVILSVNKKKKEITIKATEDINSNDVLEIYLKNKDSLPVKALNLKKGCNATISVSNIGSVSEKMYIMRTRNNMLISDTEKQYFGDKPVSKVTVGCSVTICKDMPVSIDLWHEDIFIHEEGGIPEIASSRPVSVTDIEKQILKTGGTDYIIDKNNLTICLEDNLFVNIKEINSLRRNAIASLKEKCLSAGRRNCIHEYTFLQPDPQENIVKKPLITVYVSTIKQFETVVIHNDTDYICVESDVFGEFIPEKWHEIIDTAHNNNKEIYLCLPYIFRTHGKKITEKYSDFFKTNKLDGYVFRNMEEVLYFQHNNFDRKKSIFDNTIYAFNDEAVLFLEKYKPHLITASYELNAKELKHLKNFRTELCIYGHIPVMISAGCIKKTYNQCDKKSDITSLRDRLGNEFMCKHSCLYCYNVLYNSKPLIIADILGQSEIDYMAKKIMFTTESAAETKQILNNKLGNDFTRGHFKRGVE